MPPCHRDGVARRATVIPKSGRQCIYYSTTPAAWINFLQSPERNVEAMAERQIELTKQPSYASRAWQGVNTARQQASASRRRLSVRLLCWCQARCWNRIRLNQAAHWQYDPMAAWCMQCTEFICLLWFVIMWNNDH
jgi:hypothetical protein